MLVTRIIGKCPGCGAEASFGNVHVSNNALLRGCLRCKYSQDIPLPPLSKTVLYLDQSFLSHAFRAELPEFVDAAKHIADLAHCQLLVCPYSSIHEAETHQWRSPEQQKLWEFIKQTSRGHEFSPEYKVKQVQISRGFERFLAGEKTEFAIKARDALPRDVNNWEDYFWIDIKIRPENIELRRRLKEEAVTKLISIFPDWRKDATTFDEDRRLESSDAAKNYLQQYGKMAERVAKGDFMAMLDSPVDSGIVERLMFHDQDGMNYADRLNRVIAYFNAPYFQEVPYEWISSGLFAVLKDRVKQGHYQNLDKAKERLSGLFYDVQFISTYAPYCKAMFVDNAMLDFVNDKRLGIANRFGTKFFARANWENFIQYLESIKEKKTEEFEWALTLVHP
jgi:hypothetical protein